MPNPPILDFKDNSIYKAIEDFGVNHNISTEHINEALLVAFKESTFNPDAKGAGTISGIFEFSDPKFNMYKTGEELTRQF